MVEIIEEEFQRNAVLLMVKDESLNIYKTLFSILNFADVLVVYDTGSTDETVSKIKKFCKKNNLELRLLEGEFEDFSTSRNILLRFAEEEPNIKYFLLMDCNEELQDGDKLKEILQESNKPCFNIRQNWREEGEEGPLFIDYYNVKIIRPHNGWKYTRKIHEVLMSENKEFHHPEKVPNNICLYQDRYTDQFKSEKRFESDLIILMEDYNKNKDKKHKNRDKINDFNRTLFYIGATYLSLSRMKENKDRLDELYRGALKYFKLRNDIESEYKEETYNSLMYCGSISEHFKEDWYVTIQYYLRAFEIMTRVEPLIPIASYYLTKKSYTTSFLYINFACRLEVPTASMNLDMLNYDYIRWKLMALVCLQIGTYDKDIFYAGKEALEIAIKGAEKHNKNTKLDNELMLMFANIDNIYLNKTDEIKEEDK